MTKATKYFLQHIYNEFTGRCVETQGNLLEGMIYDEPG